MAKFAGVEQAQDGRAMNADQPLRQVCHKKKEDTTSSRIRAAGSLLNERSFSMMAACFCWQIGAKGLGADDAY